MNRTPSTSATTTTTRIAFVGTGGIAKTHAKALASLRESGRLVAATDPNAQALASFTADTNVQGHASSTSLLDAIKSGATEVEALIVCTPPSVRREIVEPALDLGLDVLVEKPLASTLVEARTLADLADRHADRVTAVGYCHRFAPAILEMKRLIESGAIGRVTRFENTFAFHHPPMAQAWFSDPSVSGGGSFIDTGCHSLDIFQFLVGRPAVEGAIFDHDWPGRAESSATTLVRATDGPHAGVAGVILAGWLEPARFQVRVVGTDGALFYDYEHAESLIRVAPNGVNEEFAVETHEVRFARQIEAFIRAVQERRGAREVGLATFRDGLAVAEAVDSAQAQGKV